MKKFMSFALMCLMSITMLSAQGVEEVTLVVSGDGPTKEDATHVALRSAIEQAFGCFVSANTEILNDSLVKDEIVTITSGNIKSYEEINVATLESNNVSVTLKATVSINNLITYAQSKGSACELSGALLTQEKRMIEMNVANTKKALQHLFILVNEYVAQHDLWDYTLNIESVKLDGTVETSVICKRNANADALDKMMDNYLAAMAIDEKQAEHLKDVGFKTKRANGFTTYADLSCISYELRTSIEQFISRRTCALFTDNLGFVYPNTPAVRTIVNWNNAGRFIDLVGSGVYDSLVYKIKLHVPAQNLEKLTKIELVRFSDPRFMRDLYNSIYKQYSLYSKQHPQIGITTDDLYYFWDKVYLYFYVNRKIFNPYDNISKDKLRQYDEMFTKELSSWSNPNLEPVVVAGICIEIKNILALIRGKKFDDHYFDPRWLNFHYNVFFKE